MANDENPVAETIGPYDEMANRWDLILDLLGKTPAMRAAGEKWLPKEAGEIYGEYRTRLERTILYNGFGDTVEKLSARPFSHPISVHNIPADLEYLIDDADTTLKSFETLAQELLKDLATFGIAHIFVDHSRIAPIENGEKITIADEKQLGARAIITRISPANLIGWRTTYSTSSRQKKLTQIRVREFEYEDKGDYGVELVEYIRVWNSNGNWELHRKDDKGKYTLIDKGIFTFSDGIPLITIYANRTGFMTAEPPLEDLAWLNLAHWQSSSDQRNILRLSRFAILFGKGFPDEYITGEKALTVGPTTAVMVNNPDAVLDYVEHSGKAIEAGSKDLDDLEVKMELLGQQPLMRTSGKSTATAKRIDENRNISSLQAWIRSLQDGLVNALEFAGKWRSIQTPEDMAVDIFNDFEVVVSGQTDKDHLLKMRQAGELSRITYLKEVKRRGLLADDIDPEDEAARLESEDDSLDELLNGDSDKDISSGNGE